MSDTTALLCDDIIKANLCAKIYDGLFNVHKKVDKIYTSTIDYREYFSKNIISFARGCFFEESDTNTTYSITNIFRRKGNPRLIIQLIGDKTVDINYKLMIDPPNTTKKEHVFSWGLYKHKSEYLKQINIKDCGLCTDFITSINAVNAVTVSGGRKKRKHKTRRTKMVKRSSRKHKKRTHRKNA